MIDYEIVKADCLLMVESAIEADKVGRFNWSFWYSDRDYNSALFETNVDAYFKHDCGTTACVAGNAPTIQAFIDRGLTPAHIAGEDTAENFSQLLYGDKRAALIFNTLFFKHHIMLRLSESHRAVDEEGEYIMSDTQALQHLLDAIVSTNLVEDMVKLQVTV